MEEATCKHLHHKNVLVDSWNQLKDEPDKTPSSWCEKDEANLQWLLNDKMMMNETELAHQAQKNNQQPGSCIPNAPHDVWD